MTKQLWPWKVEDGETHWVAATGPAQAKEIVAESFGHKSVEDYVDDCGEPVVTQLDLMAPIEVNITQDASYPGVLPKSVSVIARATGMQWCELGPGLIATTCY